MPIEKTIDGRSIKFPEGYDTLEGRRRIIAEFNVRPNSQLTKKKAENVRNFIIARGIIEELGGRAL